MAPKGPPAPPKNKPRSDLTPKPSPTGSVMQDNITINTGPYTPYTGMTTGMTTRGSAKGKDKTPIVASPATSAATLKPAQASASQSAKGKRKASPDPAPKQPPTKKRKQVATEELEGQAGVQAQRLPQPEREDTGQEEARHCPCRPEDDSANNEQDIVQIGQRRPGKKTKATAKSIQKAREDLRNIADQAGGASLAESVAQAARFEEKHAEVQRLEHEAAKAPSGRSEADERFVRDGRRLIELIQKYNVKDKGKKVVTEESIEEDALEEMRKEMLAALQLACRYMIKDGEGGEEEGVDVTARVGKGEQARKDLKEDMKVVLRIAARWSGVGDD
ncbi:hypothetical protein KVT40_000653 [Elsinoe batatas]|uniref:Uncharacterized protein n=1 Tax=Elsinoe batatas TaxID=2601811 RepID=A0A8K0PLB6_9PEZI|nr:hypothetical protein KVT40_000653 [Elsinoe batatas]